MKPLLVLFFVLASFTWGQNTPQLIPQGIWPLCEAGISMPGCREDSPETYMLLTDSTAAWTLTVELESGKIVTEYGRGRADSLDFGGIVAQWRLVFFEHRSRR